MTMGLPLRCRYWSVLQVVAIIICCRGKVSSEIAEKCVESQLSLSCPEKTVIKTTKVVLGDSYGVGTYCYIRDDDCTRNANENHRRDVRRTCDYKQSCVVGVLQEKIPCGYLGGRYNNDFERITYDCIDDPRNSTMNNSTAQKESTDENSDEEQTMKPDDSEALTVIVVIICLVILLAIVVLVVVMHRRKRRAQMKLSHPVAMAEVDNRQNESDISANETQGTSLPENNDPLSLYTLIDEDDFPKTNGDPAIYSEVQLKETVWKKDQNDRLTVDKTKAALEAHSAGPDVYAVVNKPSKTSATSSALKTDQVGVIGLVNKGNCLPDQIYSLASNDMADIYANEAAVESPTRLMAEAVSMTPSPEDDGGQTVIENELYCH